MSPDTQIPGHPIATWWRRYAGLIALGAVLAISVAGFVQLESEANTRESQFCGLIVGQYEERLDRIEATKDFLETPNSKLPQTLIDLKSYIRNVSLPQTEKELDGEQKDIPQICWKYR